ncbi:MAG: hypothetical protein U9Q71_05260 [Pseudomonadota bacterium]|nr:hypothetical protein [Pseudomonadota bacterium]
MNEAELGPFLRRIQADRDRRLVEIQHREAAERKRLRGLGYAKSLELQREVANRLRREQTQNRERHMSRARAEIRRRRWRELAALQNMIAESVQQRMQEAWRQPAAQWAWCRFWLEAAHQRAGESLLHIRLSRDVDEAVRLQVEEWLAGRGVAARLELDLETPGLRIRWSNFELDGTLAAQQPHFSDAALQRLAPLMPREEPES